MKVHSVDLRESKTIMQMFPADRKKYEDLGCTILDLPADAVPDVRPGYVITVEVLGDVQKK